MKHRLPARARKTRYIKKVLLAAVLLGAGVLSALGFMVYRVSHPDILPEPLNPSYHLLKSTDIQIPTYDGKELSGWWIPGARGSAGIVLAPGFGLSCSDALSLATSLHQKGFNILLYGQRGSSASHEKASTFGLKEEADMLSALQYIRSRPESDESRIGIWGVDVGAYAALKAGATVPEVRAVVADSAYESATDFLEVRVAEEFHLNYRFLQLGCRQIFRLFYITSGSLNNQTIPVKELAGRSILIITGENRKKLGSLATALYDKLPSKKEILPLETSRIHLMPGSEFQGYDTQVADFFQKNLR
jgi:hypothetical protein